MTNHTTPRRGFLVGLAAAPAALAAPALATPAPDPDAELVRLGQEWRRRWDYLESPEGEALPEDQFDALIEERFAIEKAIWDTPARSVEGLGVKAMIAKAHDSGWGNHADYVLLADVLRLAGREV